MSNRRIHMLAVAGVGRKPSAMLCGTEMRDPERITTAESRVTCRVCAKLFDAPIAEPSHGVTLATGEYVTRAGTRKAATLRDELPPRQWLTWRSAVRYYVAWKDEGATLKSGSRPERFEPHTGGDGIARGDDGQRAAERYKPVSKAIDLGIRALGQADAADAKAARALLFDYLCGRAIERNPRSPTGEVRKRQFYPDRTIEKAHDVARLRGMSADAAHTLVNAMGRAIEAELVRRDLLVHRDDSLQDRGPVGLRDCDCVGWDSIAAALGMSRRWAIGIHSKYAATSTPMPVVKFAGLVRANARELHEWADSIATKAAS